MPRKIIDNTSNAQNTGIQVNHASSDPNKQYGQGLNKFNNSYDQAFTQRWADIHPFAVMEGIERDSIPFRSVHDLGTYTLASPLKSDVYMHKTVSLVPYQAILPNTWKLFYVNPTKGDDVPEDVYCNLDVVSFWKENFSNFYLVFNQWITETGEVSDLYVNTRFLQFLLSTESIFSTGSLFSALRMNLWNKFSYYDKDVLYTFDDFFDVIISRFISLNQVYFSKVVNDSIVNYYSPFYVSSDDDTAVILNIHDFLDMLRDSDYDNLYFDNPVNFDVTVESWTDVAGNTVTTNYADFLNVNFFAPASTFADDMTSFEIDLSRLIAYQLSCVKFMSDDSIDYIYNANLFRNNFIRLLSSYGDTFSYNDQPIVYDAFSKHHLINAFSLDNDNFDLACSLLFRFRKSLKYGDYFISSRPHPYAVGDVNAPVVNNFVSAIDITKAISEQRFTNWNNRTGMSYEEYVKGLTGSDVLVDITEPMFVSHEKFRISGFEVENTGEAQQEAGTNSITTLLKSSQSNYMFDINITDACVIIGLSHFDAKRLYTRVFDRNCLKTNRFDFFNKFYQYTGDQDIKGIELDSSRSENDVFAYCTRYMQYKQQISFAGGGFIKELPSWAFTSQINDTVDSIPTLNPDFIRNSNADFDRFYSSLSGLSLGKYFHFIVVYHNDFSEMRRPMDIAPDIL